jgi:uncharacterized repeat protein (TIGR03803 family)
MRIDYRGMAIALAALALARGALAAPVETVLYSFTGGSDGVNPLAGLNADKQGALYGTTEIGGSGNEGTVFKVMPPAKGQTVGQRRCFTVSRAVATVPCPKLAA